MTTMKGDEEERGGAGAGEGDGEVGITNQRRIKNKRKKSSLRILKTTHQHSVPDGVRVSNGTKIVSLGLLRS